MTLSPHLEWRRLSFLWQASVRYFWLRRELAADGPISSLKAEGMVREVAKRDAAVHRLFEYTGPEEAIPEGRWKKIGPTYVVACPCCASTRTMVPNRKSWLFSCPVNCGFSGKVSLEAV